MSGKKILRALDELVAFTRAGYAGPPLAVSLPQPDGTMKRAMVRTMDELAELHREAMQHNQLPTDPAT